MATSENLNNLTQAYDNLYNFIMYNIENDRLSEFNTLNENVEVAIKNLKKEIEVVKLVSIIETYNSTIDKLTEDIEFHTDGFTDTYYGLMETVDIFKAKLLKAQEQLNKLIS